MFLQKWISRHTGVKAVAVILKQMWQRLWKIDLRNHIATASAFLLLLTMCHKWFVFSFIAWNQPFQLQEQLVSVYLLSWPYQTYFNLNLTLLKILKIGTDCIRLSSDFRFHSQNKNFKQKGSAWSDLPSHLASLSILNLVFSLLWVRSRIHKVKPKNKILFLLLRI